MKQGKYFQQSRYFFIKHRVLGCYYNVKDSRLLSLPVLRPFTLILCVLSIRCGIDSDCCLDFRPNPNLEPEELWTPEGVDYIDGELVIRREQFRYDCSDTLDNYLTVQEKLELLDSHPFFTGRCPNCEMPFDMSNPPKSALGLRSLQLD